MKNLLVSKPIYKIKALFGNIDEYKARYAQLEKVFADTKLHFLFAEPVLMPEKMEIAWFVQENKSFKSYDSLSPEQQDMVKALLKERMHFLLKHIEKSTISDKEHISETLNLYFELPNSSDIYACITNGQVDSIVLIEWGCISEAFDAKRGLISLMIPSLWQPMNFKTCYPDGSIAPNQAIIFEILEQSFEMVSDSQGYIHLEEQPLYSLVKAFPKSDFERRFLQKFVCTSKNDYIITIPKTPVMVFRVIDENGNIMPNVLLNFKINNQRVNQTSDKNGHIHIAGLSIGNNVGVMDNSENETQELKNYLFDDESKIYDIVLKNKPSIMQWQVIDKKKQLVPDANVVFKYNKQKISRQSDGNGMIYLDGIKLGETVKGKAKKARRRGKKSYRFENSGNIHSIKIKKPISLWWLLLLLLPLFLLIQWNKDVQFKVVNKLSAGSTVDADVVFEYAERSFFDFRQMQFLTYDSYSRKTKTDNQNIATFPGVKVTLFSWLFYHNEPTNVIALAKCYASDTLHPAISKLKNRSPYLIELGYARFNYVFNVFDSQNKEPLPDAKVKLIVNADGANKVYDSKSGVDGKVIFMDIPTCADFTITAEAYGYNSKTIKTNGTDVFYKGKNKIPLDPLTETVVFYIKNSRNKQAVPGATAYLIIDNKTVQKTTTNINGAVSMVGQGTFTKVPVLKEMIIKGTKTDYYDSSLKAKVAMFIKANASQRTVYLRPKAQNVSVKVIDAGNRQAIAGAKVIVTVNGNRKIEYSNSAGMVNIANLNHGDKISIFAEKNPNYLPNPFMQDDDVSDLLDGNSANTTIPLQPKTPPPPPPPPPNSNPCNGGTDATHANSSDVSATYVMGKDKGTFQFSYYTDRAPDRMIIYSGNQKVFEFYGATRTKTKTAQVPFYDPVITVRVIGGTKWSYKVSCPD